jgi:DNA-binding transcriptional ArsR family regulator
MVKFSGAALDRTFAALSDPTRRALVMRLAAEPDLSVSKLAAPFAMSLPAVMKHLDVLSDAGLVSRAKTGRVVACRLDAEPMRDAFEWLNRYEKFWSERLSSLAAFLEEEAESLSEEEKSWPPKPPPNQASPSSAGSRRRPPKSLPRGRSRKR